MLGLDALDAAEWQEAVNQFDQALAREPENPDYWLARGVAHTFARRLGDAEQDLQRADRLRRDHKPTKLWWATVVAMQGRFQEGGLIYPPATLDQYENAVRGMSREFGNYYFVQTLGDDYLVEEARPRYEAAIRSFPQLAKMYVERTKSESGLGDGQGGGLALALRKRGIERYKAGQCDQAHGDLANAFLADPDDMEVLYYLAGCKLKLGSPEGARADYTQVLLASPDHGYALLGRALAHAALGDAPAARRGLADAKSLLPDLDPAYAQQIDRNFATALGTLSGQQAKERLAALQNAAAQGADWPSLTGMAFDLIRASQFDRLRADETYQLELSRLRRAADQPDAIADDFAALGQFLYEQAFISVGEAVEPRAANRPYRPQSQEGQAQELALAEAAVDRALQLDPNHARALAFKGASRFRRDNDWRRGQDYLARAIELDSRDPVILDLFAMVMDYIAFVQAAAAADLRAGDTWYTTHYIYYRYPSQAELRRANELDTLARQLWQKARRAMEQAINVAPNSAQAHYYRSILAENDGDLTGALRELQRAVQLDPSYFEAAQRLSTIASKLGQTDLAYEAQSIATNLVQTSAAPMLKLSWIDFNRTAYQKASGALDEAIALDPADPRIAAYRGAVARENGDHQAAAASFLTAVALEEMRLKNSGLSVRQKAPVPYGADDISRLLALYNAAAAEMNAVGRADQAVQLMDAGFLVYENTSQETKYTRSAYGLLPETLPDPSRIPEAPTIEALAVWAAVHAGRAKTTLNDLDGAIRLFEWASAFESRKPSTMDQGMAVRLPGLWARLGLVDLELKRGNPQGASQRMQMYGFPSIATPQMEAEAARLRNAIEGAGYRAGGQTLHDLRDQQNRQLQQQQQNRQTW